MGLLSTMAHIEMVSAHDFAVVRRRRAHVLEGANGWRTSNTVAGCCLVRSSVYPGLLGSFVVQLGHLSPTAPADQILDRRADLGCGIRGNFSCFVVRS